jgi:hypothetical protein
MDPHCQTRIHHFRQTLLTQEMIPQGSITAAESIMRRRPSKVKKVIQATTNSYLSIMPHAHTHFNLGRVVADLQLHVSVIFWEIQKAPLATVFRFWLYVLLFVLFFSHP